MFAKEADLCTAFIKSLPETWVAYCETQGFDIVLVRKEDGLQIGVEAKLKLNAKVINQAAEEVSRWGLDRPAPDCRAVLVPSGVNGDLAGICRLLGITVIYMRPEPIDSRDYRWHSPFFPKLPDIEHGAERWASDWWDWFDRAPTERLKMPDYVPDVEAGHSAPRALTPWKVKAIKIAILIEKRGTVNRTDFKAIEIDMSRWTNPYAKWLVRGEVSKQWVAGPRLPDFRAQHPVNYEQIEADFDTWAPPILEPEPDLI